MASKAKNSGLQRILKNREYTQQLSLNQQDARKQQELTELALWEQKSGEKIAKNVAALRYRELQAKAEAALDARRQRLSDKLWAEDQAIQSELAQSAKPDPAKQRAALMERAKALKAERERERVAYVNEQNYIQWRMSCDPLRARDSQMNTMEVAEARKTQVDEKYERLRAEVAQTLEFDAMYEQDRMKKEQRFQQDQRNRKLLEDQGIRALNDQMSAVIDRRGIAAQEHAEDVREMKAKWANDDRLAAEAEEERKRHARKHRDEVAEFNLIKMTEVERIEAEERALDKAIVDAAVKRAMEEEEREAQLKDKRREQARMYRQHLEVAMRIEAESENAFEEAVQAEADRKAAQMQAQKDREEQMRRDLMAEVDRVRQAQIAEKQKLAMMGADDRVRERELANEETDAMDAVEAEFAARRRAAAKQHQMEVVAQIRAKEDRKEMEALQRQREIEGAHRAEAAYMGLVDRDIANPERPKINYGRKSTQWFT